MGRACSAQWLGVAAALAMLGAAIYVWSLRDVAQQELHDKHAGEEDSWLRSAWPTWGQAQAHPAVLLLVKLRPSKVRSKASVVDMSKAWKPSSWGAEGPAAWSVVDHNALVLTCASRADALKAKAWLFEHDPVYELELNPGSQVFRRPGDPPLQEVKRHLARAAAEERRARGWAWLRRNAQQQGVAFRPRKRRRPGRPTPAAATGQLPQGAAGEL